MRENEGERIKEREGELSEASGRAWLVLWSLSCCLPMPRSTSVCRLPEAGKRGSQRRNRESGIV